MSEKEIAEIKEVNEGRVFKTHGSSGSREGIEAIANLNSSAVENIDPDKKSLVLHITTSFGKHYTCRTVDELETFIDNYLAALSAKPANKNRKIRDEDVGIQIGFGRMTESEYAQIPACKYFIKEK